MIKKLIILAIVIVVAFYFYKNFMASTMHPFFKKNTGNVDLMNVDSKTGKKAMGVLK
jgi:uncharacterized protein YxeA